MADQPIPEDVLEVLEEVRSGGETNMLARDTVIALADSISRDYDEAVAWLEANKDRYMEALNAMGARRSRA